MTVYLDNAATTPLSEPARTAMEPFWDVRFGNASEPHRLGREAREALEDARGRVARVVGADPGQVVFTSGGTEASNQAVFGLAGHAGGRMVASAIEHSAVREPLFELGAARIRGGLGAGGRRRCDRPGAVRRTRPGG